MENRILFRVNAGENYGWGHFSRSHALAYLLKEVNILFFLNADCKKTLNQKIDKSIHAIYILNEDDFFKHIKPNDIVILDGYEFVETYRNKVKAKCKRLICIEDLPNGHYTCDAILNSANDAKKQYYSADKHTRFFFGYEYALLNKVFFEPILTTKRYGIVISMGSIDPFNITTAILKALLNQSYTQSIHVIYTDYFNLNQQQFIEKVASENKINAYKNLTALEVKNLMDKSQFGIFPTSNVLLEALKRQITCAFGYFVDNQIPNYQSFTELNVGFPLGKLTDVLWNDVLVNFFGTTKTNAHLFADIIGSKIYELKSFILYGN